jgi:hypothetical protein
MRILNDAIPGLPPIGETGPAWRDWHCNYGKDKKCLKNAFEHPIASILCVPLLQIFDSSVSASARHGKAYPYGPNSSIGDAYLDLVSQLLHLCRSVLRCVVLCCSLLLDVGICCTVSEGCEGSHARSADNDCFDPSL